MTVPAVLHDSKRRKSKTLFVTGLVHALHDGLSDMVYVLLPIWQAQFGLGYAAVALLKTVHSGAMASFQIPASWLARRLGNAAVLALGTFCAAIGFAIAGLAGGLGGLFFGLFLAGVGASVQHPIGSAIVAQTYGDKARGPLGVYNFSGDVGKVIGPFFLSLILAVIAWRLSLLVVACLAAVAALAILLLLPSGTRVASDDAAVAKGRGRKGFRLLFGIGILDSSVRSGVLVFLPFLLQAKGADITLIGTALALVFAGGAAGKFVCGWLGEHLGVRNTVLLTETGTALAALLLLALPLYAALILLPLLGLMLNGTSSVLYGTVPEVAQPGKTEHAFAMFYTGGIGSSAVSPVLFGALGDVAGLQWGMAAAACAALLTAPLVILLEPTLKK